MEVVKGPDNAGTRDEALTRLVDEYQTPLLRICYMYLKDAQLAEDAVQETFLKACRSLESFRGECSEKTWLMRIAVNVCRDLRKSAWHRHVDRRITPDMLPEPAAPAREEDGELLALVMNLPRRLREVTLLYYYQDMDTYEIAQALGISRSSVSGRLERARRKLREVLERGNPDE